MEDSVSQDNSFSLEELVEACQSAGTTLVSGSEHIVPNNPVSADVISTNNDNQNAVEEYPGDMEAGRKRRKKADRSKWKKEIVKRKRMLGDEYQSFSTKNANQEGLPKVTRSKRKLGSHCTSKYCQKRKQRYCASFTHNDRRSLFHQFWKTMTWDEKKAYVTSHIDQHKSVRKTTEGVSRRKDTFSYYLKLRGQKRQVCKDMFLKTLGLKEKQVYGWISASSISRAPKPSTTYQTNKRKFANEFLDALPKLPSHYCRKSTSKLYLEPIFNSQRQLYRVYLDWCKERNKAFLARSAFLVVVEERNISLYHPRKDECDLCCSYKAGNMSTEMYQEHISKKNDARTEKEKDKAESKSGKCRVITMDLQSVLLSPLLNASALYYKTKIIVHNFTIYDLKTKSVCCYLWDETEGEQASSNFATCLIDYLEEVSESLPIIIYSDGCTAQNRNVNLSNAILDFAKRKGIIVYQKFLEKGHTQMEVDSVHSAIERKLKSAKIFVPQDYVDICKQARHDPEPYSVKYMTHDKFRNYSSSPSYASIRPGNKKGDPCVTDLRCIKYNPTGTIEFKLDFKQESNWRALPRNPNIVNSQYGRLYEKRIPITKRKYQDIMDLLHVIPEEHHNFYKEVPKL